MVTWRNVLCWAGARVAAFAAFSGAFSSLCASKKAPSDLTQAPKLGCTLMRGRSHLDTWRCVRSSCKGFQEVSAEASVSTLLHEIKMRLSVLQSWSPIKSTHASVVPCQKCCRVIARGEENSADSTHTLKRSSAKMIAP